MTLRIYYTEPYRRSFDATVIDVQAANQRSHVTLDQTVFYPTSGGQPFDTGTLGGAAVVDVIDNDDGTVTHVVSGSLRAGDIVSGEIDWARRFDHMQQHTGQHVLSAAFDRLFGVRTESFHMGQQSSTIDLAREVTAAEVVTAEDDANRIVWEDRQVAIRFATADEAAQMGMRKESARSGTLRLIDVTDYDLSACGGTHVDRTGAIGIIAVGSVEKFKGGSRVEFLCGGRALERFRSWKGALSAMQKHLSVPPVDMAASIERMQEDAKSAQRHIRGFQEKLAAHEARALLAKGSPVVEAIDGWDAHGIKSIAAAITAADPNAVVALFTTTAPSQVVIARGSSSRVDAGALLKQLTAKCGGKGGGKADLAQGGSLAAPVSELIDTVRALVRNPTE
jgi:alanyl-tRNA synthetase